MGFNFLNFILNFYKEFKIPKRLFIKSTVFNHQFAQEGGWYYACRPLIHTTHLPTHCKNAGPEVFQCGQRNTLATFFQHIYFRQLIVKKYFTPAVLQSH
jgi:hypothetical protein